MANTTYDLFIHGTWVPPSSKEYLDVMDPSKGETLARIARGLPSEVDQAIDSAQEGFLAWSGLDASRRSRILLEISRVLRSRIDQMAELEAKDCGSSLEYSKHVVDEIAGRRFEYYGGLADKITGLTIPMPNGHFDYTIEEPLGVTLHITPWNGPLWSGTRSVVPALAAGNSVVLRPSKEALLNLLELAEICSAAGMPAGTFNVITGLSNEIGEALVTHPKVDCVAFTGSVEVGKQIMSSAAQGVKPVVMELGGKSPNIVFEDADLSSALSWSVQGAFAGAGQICVAGSRLLVQKSIHDAFLEALLERVGQLRVGPAMSSPDMGPLISERQLQNVLDYIDVGKDEGAELVQGGVRLSGGSLKNGFYLAPTIFDAVDNQMRIAREEIFGPVLSLITFEDEEDAVRIANDSDFGLAAAIWTQDLSRAHRVAANLEAGSIYINRYFSAGIEAPAGGCKFSGFGRLDGVEALREYTQTKNVTINLGS